MAGNCAKLTRLSIPNLTILGEARFSFLSNNILEELIKWLKFLMRLREKKSVVLGRHCGSICVAGVVVAC